MRSTAWQTAILLLALLAAVTTLAETTLPASKRHKDGEAIYRFACARCHDFGEGGAPVTGSPKAGAAVPRSGKRCCSNTPTRVTWRAG